MYSIKYVAHRPGMGAGGPKRVVDVTVMVPRFHTTFCFSVGLHFEVGKVGSIWSGMVRRVYIWLTIGFC